MGTAPVVSLDQTRQLCDITLDGAPARQVAAGPAAEAAVTAALLAGAGVLASEQFGLAERALEITVAYVKERHQFARPVGGFQAIKHRLADLWVAVTQARAAARSAANGLSAANGAESELAVALAKAACSDTALKAAQEMIQLHGGIGFTWEHPAHLFLKRAKADSIGFGTADAHRASLARLANLPPPRGELDRRRVARPPRLAAGGRQRSGRSSRDAGRGGRRRRRHRRAAAASARRCAPGVCRRGRARRGQRHRQRGRGGRGGRVRPAARAVAGDAATETGVTALIAAARSALGEIDLYCANAGHRAGRRTRGRGVRLGGLLAGQRDGARSRGAAAAARWLERGSGHFISTVSAAGLLAMPGTAPYTVTKHAALSFAEWLGFTYAHRGITVQAICPLGVRTPMLPADGPASKLLGDAAIEPDAVADAVIAGIADGRFLILPHPEVAGHVRRPCGGPGSLAPGHERDPAVPRNALTSHLRQDQPW